MGSQGYLDIWINFISGCICENESKLPFPVWVGIIHTTERLNRTRKWRENLLFSLIDDLEHWFSPAGGLKIVPSVRKASGVAQSESKGLRTRGADAVNLCLRTGGEMQCPSSSSEAGGKGPIPPFPTFGLIQALSRWLSAHLHGESELPNPLILTLIIWITLPKAPDLVWSGHPLGQSSWHIKSTFIRGVKCVHLVVQPPLPSSSWMFSSSQPEIWHPLTPTPYPSLPLPLVTTIPPAASVTRTPPGPHGCGIIQHWSFSAGLTSLHVCPQGLSPLWLVSGLHSFFRLNNTPLCGWIIVCVPIHLGWTCGLFPLLGCCALSFF